MAGSDGAVALIAREAIQGNAGRLTILGLRRHEGVDRRRPNGPRDDAPECDRP